MTRLPILALALAIAAGPALAGPKGHCPPGLAKKAVPCVPPGQAKKGLGIGDRYDHDRYRYEPIRDYDRWDLPPIAGNEGYYRDGYIVYRVDRDTRRVLALIRLAEILGSQ